MVNFHWLLHEWQQSLHEQQADTVAYLGEGARDLKMQEMPFQRPKFQKKSGGICPWTPLKLCRHYGLPSLKSLLRHWSDSSRTRVFKRIFTFF